MTPKYNVNAEKIWNYLIEKGFAKSGIAGLMGNLYAESGLNPNNLENWGNSVLGVTDEQYTDNVNSGRYSRNSFGYDQKGYGLAQWTYFSRKLALYDYAHNVGKPIDDLYMQLDFLVKELKEKYKVVYNCLMNVTSVREASNSIVVNFERPKGYETWEVQNKRYEIGQYYYDQFANKVQVETGKVESAVNKPMLQSGSKGQYVKELQQLLIKNGYPLTPWGADGDFGNTTYNAVVSFQRKKGLEVDGIVGNQTWAALIGGNEAKKEESVVKPVANTQVNRPMLQRGSKGQYVKEAQELLIAKNYSCGNYGADGDFGYATYSAVIAFQRANGLEADGIIGNQTWNALLTTPVKNEDPFVTNKTEEVGSNESPIEKLIRIARAEIGYLEKASNYNLDDKKANAGYNNWNKYARDIDTKWPNFYNGKKNGYAWCDCFADWCFLTAFGYDNALKLLYAPEHSCGAGCQYSANYYRNHGAFYRSNPQPGDQIFFGNYGSEGHIGIVYKVADGKVYTIEGNTSGGSGVDANGGGVYAKEYSLNSGYIAGYGRPNWKILD